MLHYKLANSDCIQRAIKNIDWEKAFLNADVNKKVFLFSETILNIIRNFIPHEVVTCDDRDPPWMTRLIKKAIKDKNLFYQRFVENTDFTNNNSNVERFCSFQNNLTIAVETAKQQYFAKIAKKLSVRNSSVIPTDFKLFTDKSLSNITFIENDIGRIISSLDPNKGLDHDMMSIRMLKICDDSINKPLRLIFRACLEHGMFPQNWKKANVIPIHLKKTTSNQ